MRKIKFRAWDKEYNKMYYNAERTYDFGLNDSDIMEESFGGVLNNDNFIVMQYTGLADFNGKEIYEGDILQDIKGRIYKIIWDEFLASFESPDFYCSYQDEPKRIFSEYAHTNMSVIGNIYETPDLLK